MDGGGGEGVRACGREIESSFGKCFGPRGGGFLPLVYAKLRERLVQESIKKLRFFTIAGLQTKITTKTSRFFFQFWTSSLSNENSRMGWSDPGGGGEIKIQGAGIPRGGGGGDSEEIRSVLKCPNDWGEGKV